MTSTSEEGGVVRKNSMVAVTSSEREELSVNWRIENFMAETAVSASKERRVLSVSFCLGGGGGQGSSSSALGDLRVPLVCRLSVSPAFTVDLTLSLGKLEEGGVNSSAAASKISPHLWTLFRVENCKKNLTVVLFGDKEPKKLAFGGWGRQFFYLRDAFRFVETDGSLTLTLKVTTIALGSENVTAVATPAVVDDDDVAAREGEFREGVLTAVESLLGDEKTSDVTISVVDGENEVGRFFCHRAILSARSRVFREMFHQDGMSEGVLSVEDVSVGVTDAFLTFLYSGRLTGKSAESAWVKMLPHLAYLADKYEVGDLKEFCDDNLHRAVNEANALDIYFFAKGRGLTKTAAKLRKDYLNVDVLLNSMVT